MSNLYEDGTYLEVNPDLHEEDSDFKFSQIKPWLEKLSVEQAEIKVLDVGGGAGKLGRLVGEVLERSGYQPKFTALDLSQEMLDIQRSNNPYIVETCNEGLEKFENRRFDLTLMIDVIEHIPTKDLAAQKLNALSDYIIYNIPIEINAVDLLRNIYMKGRHYPLQTETLGHVHFFNFASAKKLLAKHHRVLASRFVPYCSHILKSDSPVYKELRTHRLRRIELLASDFVCSYLKPMSPWLVQGSVYSLTRSR